ncbi:MAG: TrmH family RNA methyltransferase [Marinirhabdus sp.]|nr:TrmH family RNA methyltransferase [Marinirhabdus sp.]
MTQHTHRTVPFSPKENDIYLLCDGIQSPANIGAIFRLCDAFGVKEIVFSQQPDLTSNRLKRTARNTENRTVYRVTDDMIGTLDMVSQKGYHTMALEISEHSIQLPKANALNHKKIALLIGNERSGVSAQLLNTVHEVVHIEMFGANSSMNVAQATAIALYELTKH